MSPLHHLPRFETIHRTACVCVCVSCKHAGFASRWEGKLPQNTGKHTSHPVLSLVACPVAAKVSFGAEAPGLSLEFLGSLGGPGAASAHTQG